MGLPPDTALDRLTRALSQEVAADPNGAWFLRVQGTQNIIGAGSGGTSAVEGDPFTTGGSSVTPIGAYHGPRSGLASGNVYIPHLNASGVLEVAVVSQPAGGGAGFASVAVYGSPGMPIYAVGSVHVVNPQGTVTIANMPTVNLGSGIVGSVRVTPVATFTVALDKVATVDYRAGLTATQWTIQHAGSGHLAIIPAPTGRIRLHHIQLLCEGTSRVQLFSPSGTAITGSQHLVAGAGFVAGAPIGTPVLQGGVDATVFLNVAGSQPLGGWAVGWIE